MSRTLFTTIYQKSFISAAERRHVLWNHILNILFLFYFRAVYSSEELPITLTIARAKLMWQSWLFGHEITFLEMIFSNVAWSPESYESDLFSSSRNRCCQAIFRLPTRRFSRGLERNGESDSLEMCVFFVCESRSI